MVTLDGTASDTFVFTYGGTSSLNATLMAVMYCSYNGARLISGDFIEDIPNGTRLNEKTYEFNALK